MRRVGTGAPPPSPRTVVFLRTDPDTALDDLGADGIQVNQTKGKVRTAILPVDRIDQLSEDPRVHRIHPTRYLKLAMDVAALKIGVPDFKTNLGLDGTGVVVGFVDSGIDGSHPAFQGRVHSVWDQTISGNGVPEGGYGRELSGERVGDSTDENGHGTHVAGIATGQDDGFGGVAPGATIVFVKSDLLNGHIADGIKYIFRVAGELGLPAVVNLSLGGHGDAHDGTDALSEDVDDQSGPGRIVCCAAGNEGDDDIHAQLQVGPGTTATQAFRIPAATDQASGQQLVPNAHLNGWYAAGDQIEVAVQAPSGMSTPFQRVITSGNPSRTHFLPGALVRITTPGPSPDNGDVQFLVEIQSQNLGAGLSSAGVWRLRLRAGSIAQGRVDVWALDDAGGGAITFRRAGVADSSKVGSPGAASRAITVASFTTKVEWTDQGGTPRSVQMTVDDISSFSSEGPLRDGGPKPDIAAPGAMIVSALSSASSPADAFRVSPRLQVNAGTSMACPFVAGTVALLLQRDPTLSPENAKAALQAAASIPGAAAGSFDAKWGRGVIDCAALERALSGKA